MAKTKSVSVPTNLQKFNASLLQFVPKGSYYNSQNEHFSAIAKVWNDFLKTDRTIFSLSTLLPGTAYSKGRMAHLLLSNPVKPDVSLPFDFEKQIILWNLYNEKDMAKAIKNLLMLTGIKNKDKSFFLKRINNHRSQNIILEYIFKRDDSSLEAMALKFKNKLAKLVRHALGSQDLTKVLSEDGGVMKRILRFNPHAMPVVFFLFNKVPKIADKAIVHFEKIQIYQEAQKAAKKKNVKEFLKIAEKNVLPFEVLLGFRNTFKLDIPKEQIYSKGVLSEKQKIQSQSAAKKSGAEIKINYNTADIYDLWKLFYVKSLRGETDDLDKIAEGIQKQSKKTMGIDLGEIVVIFDASRSMQGSDIRPLHPLLTGLSLISKMDNIKDVIYVGGEKFKTGSEILKQIVIPSGSTALWEALLQAAEKKPKTILVISDGYENSVKGAFEHVYNQLKSEGADFNLIHINPVFASEVSGLRQLCSDASPMALDNYQYLKTNLIFELVTKDQHLVKQMLMEEYRKLLGGNKNG